ncbi:MAG: D-galactonate transporter DgoT [Gammaproteobacteria bacterium]|nr:D-galactonate transporter DgoT [Gammaproteobacteria bacterium]
MERSAAVDSSAAAAETAARPTRTRFLILALITVGTLINYLDRTVISVAAPFLQEDLRLDPFYMGLAFSAFSWSYAAAQIPGGVLLDRIGVRLTYFLSVTIWSLCTALQGLSSGLASLLSARLALGVAESPAFPCNSRVLSTWFPQHERARATGVYSIGQYFGLAFLSPVLFWISARFGWRMLFVLVGLLGVLFGLVWLTVYRDPQTSRSVNQSELQYIAAGGGLGDRAAPTKFDWRNIAFLLRQRQVLGASIGQFASNSTLVFFLTWFPTYLATERHMGWIKVGFAAVLPFIAATIGVVSGGVLSDFLLRRTGSANMGRKLPVVAGLLLASSIVAANFLDNDALVIAIMSLAFFGQGMCNLGWTLITDVAPKRLIGLTTGLFNLCANCAGIVTPLVVGFVVKVTGSFAWALAFIAALALCGVSSYVFLLGDVRRVEMPGD